LLCPITSKEKGYTLECAVRIKKIQGAVLIDQLRGVDWGARKIKFIEKIDSKTLADILYKLSLLVS
jgi:mRNA interferase MazF